MWIWDCMHLQSWLPWNAISYQSKGITELTQNSSGKTSGGCYAPLFLSQKIDKIVFVTFLELSLSSPLRYPLIKLTSKNIDSQMDSIKKLW